MYRVCILSSVHTALDNRIFYREARSLRDAGFEVIMIAIHPQEEVIEGIQIFPLPRLPRWQRPRLWFNLYRRALQTKSEIYHFHDPELLIIGACLHLLAGKRTVYDIHESNADFILIKEDIPAVIRFFMYWIIRICEPFLARLQTALIFADEQIAQDFRKIKLPKAVLSNFPDRIFIDNATQATQGDELREPIILYLGGLKKNRGTKFMLDVLTQVLREVPQARLFLVGPCTPTSLEAELRGEIAQRGLSQSVVMTGRVPFEQVGNYLRKASVGWIAFPAVAKYQKNIPTKLFEYMAYSIPVVSSDLPPVRSFLQHGVTGLLSEAGNVSSHADALIYLLKNPKIGLQMGRAGQVLVSRYFSWDEMEKRLVELYRQILPSVYPEHSSGKL